MSYRTEGIYPVIRQELNPAYWREAVAWRVRVAKAKREAKKRKETEHPEKALV